GGDCVNANLTPGLNLGMEVFYEISPEKKLGFQREYANKMMKISSELNPNSYTYMNLHTTSMGAKLVKT
ncbi:hypothetical protein FH121_11125, partial [Staphylococcus hominis]|nr:hypothetical protein [Staphylococcus hominis]